MCIHKICFDFCLSIYCSDAKAVLEKCRDYRDLFSASFAKKRNADEDSAELTIDELMNYMARQRQASRGDAGKPLEVTESDDDEFYR